MLFATPAVRQGLSVNQPYQESLVKRTISIIALVIALITTGCASSTTITPSAITLTDGLGRAITLAAPAQRIVSLAASNTEILFAIGAGSQVVGRDDFSDDPEAASNLPTVGGSMGSYNLEAIAALNPDLVLAAEINTPEQVQSLEDLGITVYYLSNPVDLEGMYANLSIVGQLTGRAIETEALVSSLRQRVDAIDKIIATAASKPVVFYELDGSEPSKPWTTGSGTFLDALITRAAGVNAAATLSGQYGQMSIEDLIVQNPEIILLGDAAYGVTLEQVAARPGWEGIAAVQANQIYAFDDDLVSLPGPRLVDGYETLAKLIHPELFK